MVSVKHPYLTNEIGSGAWPDLILASLSSNLYMWDLRALNPIWTVPAAPQSDLNSINSICFLLDSEHEFLSPAPQNAFSAERRRTTENVMTRFGDTTLALFHKYNLTFSNNWGDLINLVRSDPNNQDATQMVSEMNDLFPQSLRTELERAAQLSRGQTAVPDPMRQPGPAGKHFSNYPDDSFQDGYDDDEE